MPNPHLMHSMRNLGVQTSYYVLSLCTYPSVRDSSDRRIFYGTAEIFRRHWTTSDSGNSHQSLNAFDTEIVNLSSWLYILLWCTSAFLRRFWLSKINSIESRSIRTMTTPDDGIPTTRLMHSIRNLGILGCLYVLPFKGMSNDLREFQLAKLGQSHRHFQTVPKRKERLHCLLDSSVTKLKNLKYSIFFLLLCKHKSIWLKFDCEAEVLDSLGNTPSNPVFAFAIQKSRKLWNHGLLIPIIYRQHLEQYCDIPMFFDDVITRSLDLRMAALTQSGLSRMRNHFKCCTIQQCKPCGIYLPLWVLPCSSDAF